MSYQFGGDSMTNKPSSKASHFAKLSTGLIASLMLWGQPSPAQQKGSDRMDLKKLEDKYWEAKDSDMGVVQNRTYTKDDRFFLSASYGPLVNDAYSIGRMTNFAAGYYFSERWGFEAVYETGALKDNDSTLGYANQNAVAPNYNIFKSWTGINAIFVPFYAKMSFLDRAIMYFDMQFSLGVGTMAYQSQIDPLEGPHRDASALGFSFDFTQQLFFSKHVAIRLDLKNKWSAQDTYRYRKGSSKSEDERPLGKKSQQDTSFLIGLTFFF
jgi:outer membrane beta-barrel protein